MSTVIYAQRSPTAFSGSGGVLSRIAVDALVAGLAIASAVIARIAIEYYVGGVAPFILTFPAVMVATLVNGGRAGTIAAFGCQLLTIRYVFPNWVSTHGGISTDLANVVLSTAALAGTVWATASARQTAIDHRMRCEKRAKTLRLLISEMNHRTKNNFQVAAGLLGYQSVSSVDRELSAGLDKAASRLEAIAAVYDDLSNEETLQQRVDLAHHLGRVLDKLRIGAVPEHVMLSYKAERSEATPESATIIGLIVNEWVMNALKHAFDGHAGRISVELCQDRKSTRVIVHDDGAVNDASTTKGRGSDLVESLADVIDATTTVEYRNGRRCSLVVHRGDEPG